MRDKLILLVEDNESEVTLMRLALRRNGVTAKVTIARDGQEALDILLLPSDGNGNRHPSVVLLDLKLPKVSGLEVLKIVRSQQRLRILPVIVLSGSGREEDIRDAYLLGANSYVRKPVSFDQFSEAVKQLSLYWLALNEPMPL
jgi:two-component system response regulator